MTAEVSKSQRRAAIAAALDCADTMEAQGEPLQTSLPALATVWKDSVEQFCRILQEQPA